MWTTGKIGEYSYQIKHFEEGSMYGIDDGRISVLEIRKDEKILVSYSRGWEIMPDTEDEETTEIFCMLLARYN